ncbi:MAG: hypothetical protein LBT30_00460 [Clostridiales bacterium]|jgi:phage shock protein PspC (stress-responsive transcriptional regulator)|nr:hypothetical protein [Clostridiales bacterium]
MKKKIGIVAAFAAVVAADIAYIIFAFVKKARYELPSAVFTDAAHSLTVAVIIFNAVTVAAIAGYFIARLVMAKKAAK